MLWAKENAQKIERAERIDDELAEAIETGHDAGVEAAKEEAQEEARELKYELAQRRGQHAPRCAAQPLRRSQARPRNRHLAVDL
jgi:flagellar biosynthesis/type III secretory pathway protein FliH